MGWRLARGFFLRGSRLERANLVVQVWFQNADEGHHAHHSAAPGAPEAVRLGLRDLVIHHDKHVLRIAGHHLRLARLHTAWHLVFHAMLLLEGEVGGRLLEFGAKTDSAPHAGAVLFRQSVAPPQHAHAFLHPHTHVHALAAMRHRAYHRNHLVHHMVGHVTVQHPVAWILRFELDIASLGDPQQHGVGRSPGHLGYTPSLTASHVELVAVEVNGVM